MVCLSLLRCPFLDHADPPDIDTAEEEVIRAEQHTYFQRIQGVKIVVILPVQVDDVNVAKVGGKGQQEALLPTMGQPYTIPALKKMETYY